KGIKRHFLVDILGLIICVVVHAANIQERDGAKLVLQKASRQSWPRLTKILSDDGYSGQAMRDFSLQHCGWEFESVKRTELHKLR
ncbi:MAG: transposase, partial [Planctomycetaceae bacterium]|nr:transposase [Planctomycetaceae bacterium]